MANSFMCMIKDKALTGYERLVVGMTSGGFFREIFRDAMVSFENDAVVVYAWTDPMAGGSCVVTAKMPIKDIAEVRFSLITYTEMVKEALFRSIVRTGSVFLTLILTLFILSIFMSKIQLHAPNLGFVLGCFLVMCLLFSFLPSYLKLERNLIQVLLVTPDSKALVIVIKAETKSTVFRVCNAHGFKISDTTPVSDTSITDKDNVTELIAASLNGHREVVQAMIDKGADINAKTNDGVTALIAASQKGHQDIKEMLIREGAK